jgi:type I restriction enzyme S subunit
MSFEWCRLETLAAGQSGSIAIGPFGSRMKSDCYTDSGVAIIRGTNLSGSRHFSGEFVFVSDEKAKELGNANVSAEDLVFPHRGSIGSVGLVPDDGVRYVLSSSLMKITLDTERATPAFYYYFFRSQRGQAELLKNASQVGTPGIATPLTSLRSCMVPCIPMDQQIAAVAILSSLDDRIALLRESNATLEAIAQALFKSWFVDFDPVRAKAEGREPEGMSAEVAGLFPTALVQSQIGLVPKGWDIKTLQDLLVLQRGFDLPSDQRVPGNYPIIAASGPSGTHVIAMAKGPGVVTGRSGVIGKVFLELDDYWPLNTSLWIKEFRAATPCYAYELLKCIDLASFNAGSAVPTLNRNHIHSLPYVIPPIDLVSAYEAIALSLHKRARENAKHAETLAAIRDALLPRLISGQLILPEADALLKDAA